MVQLALEISSMLLVAELSLAGTPTGKAEPAWTSAGWYLVEERQDGSDDTIRVGPFPDVQSCASVRARDYPPVLAGHPELDTYKCRQLLTVPNSVPR